jgi:hypothetical protein
MLFFRMDLHVGMRLPLAPQPPLSTTSVLTGSALLGWPLVSVQQELRAAHEEVSTAARARDEMAAALRSSRLPAMQQPAPAAPQPVAAAAPAAAGSANTQEAARLVSEVRALVAAMMRKAAVSGPEKKRLFDKVGGGLPPVPLRTGCGAAEEVERYWPKGVDALQRCCHKLATLAG